MGGRRSGRGSGLALALLAAVAAAGMTACAGLAPRAPQDALRGELRYRERMALPPGARFEVRLLREGAGGGADVVGVAEGDAPRAGVVPFEIGLRRLEPGATYRLDAVISVGARPWFATPTPPPEIDLAGGQRQVVLVLVRAR